MDTNIRTTSTTRKQILASLFFTCLLLPAISNAEPVSINCSVEPYKGSVFTELYTKTQETARHFCQSLIQTRLNQNSLDIVAINNHTRQLLSNFANISKQALEEKNLAASANYTDQLTSLTTTFNQFDFSDPLLPEFKVKKKLVGNKTEGYFAPVKADVSRFTIKEVDQCPSVSSGMSCKAVFRDFADAFNPYRSAYNTVYDNTQQLDALGKQWDRFLDVSKSQTALEVWLTTLFHRKHFKKNHLVGPPSSQIIALHPHLIYSNMDKAPDGSNQELGLAVEWLGINFWDWKVPFGISYTTTYVDRAGFDDKGKGIMIHINNHYAIGWAEHGDEDTVYVTIDLLKLFEGKQQQYQSYLKKYY